jgi:hypothetical protein
MTRRGDGDSAINCPVYGYTFTHFGPSASYLEPAWFAVNIADTTVPVAAGPMPINQRYVACNPAGTAWLASLGRAFGATVACFYSEGATDPVRPGRCLPAAELGNAAIWAVSGPVIEEQGAAMRRHALRTMLLCLSRVI